MRSRRRKIALAVVAIAAWLAIFSHDEEPEPPAPRTELECLAPVGPVDAYGEFRWRYPLPEGGSYELRIYDPGYSLVGALPDLTEPRWTPPAEVEAQLPDEITWEVFARDADGSDLSSGRAEAERP